MKMKMLELIKKDRPSALKNGEPAFKLLENKPPLSERIFFWLLLIFVYLTFNLLLVDTFFTATEGWFQEYASLMHSGLVPYKDFYLFIPPVYPRLFQFVYYLFGESYLALRLVGVALRVVLVSLAYYILQRFFKPSVCFIALMTSSVVYIANYQEVFYGYYQLSLLFAVAALVFCVELSENFAQKSAFVFALLFGAMSAVTFFTKQTIGLVLPFALVVMFLVSCIPQNLKRSLALLGTFFIGVLAVSGAVISALAYEGALGAFVTQVFGGASAKGSIFKVLFGFLKPIFSRYETYLFCLPIIGYFIMCVLEKRVGSGLKLPGLLRLIRLGKYVIVLSYIVGYAMLALLQSNCMTGVWKNSLPAFAYVVVLVAFAVILFVYASKAHGTTTVQKLFFIAFALLLAAAFIFMVSHNYEYTKPSEFRTMRTKIHAELLLLEIGFSIWVLSRVVLKKQYKLTPLLIVSVAGWGIMYIHGFSSCIEDHAMLLSLALVIGFLLTVKTPLNTLKNGAVSAVCVIAVLSVFAQRVEVPYHWYAVGRCAPAQESTFTLSDPLLKGLKTDCKTAGALNSIYNTVENTKQEGDTMYTFPNITYFNTMSGLHSPTFAPIHYFDVCSDEIAVSDAKRLLEEKPTYIVWADLSEEEWVYHEMFFRNSELSGQREIQKAYNELTGSGEYELLGTYEFYHSRVFYLWHLVSAE